MVKGEGLDTGKSAMFRGAGLRVGLPILLVTVVGSCVLAVAMQNGKSRNSWVKRGTEGGEAGRARLAKNLDEVA
jgi:hypothetical protein